MKEPDLQSGALSIWVLSRAFPESRDYFDGNWLVVRATVNVGRSSVTTEGVILMTADFARFRDELATMQTTLVGEARLDSYEPNLKLVLSARSLGHISWKLEITPDHLNEHHTFEDGFDQTYIKPLIDSCDAILERFPVVGHPGS